MKLRLKEFRKLRGLSQRKLAEIAGLSPSYYADLERGDKIINANRLTSIATALGVDVVDLIDSHGDDEDIKMRTEFASLSEHEKQLVRQMVSSLASKHRKN